MLRCVLHGAFYLKIIRSPYDLEDCKMHWVTSPFKLTVFNALKWTLGLTQQKRNRSENCERFKHVKQFSWNTTNFMVFLIQMK